MCLNSRHATGLVQKNWMEVLSNKGFCSVVWHYAAMSDSWLLIFCIGNLITIEWRISGPAFIGKWFLTKKKKKQKQKHNPLIDVHSFGWLPVFCAITPESCILARSALDTSILEFSFQRADFIIFYKVFTYWDKGNAKNTWWWWWTRNKIWLRLVLH